MKQIKMTEFQTIQFINEFNAWFHKIHRSLGSAFEREAFFNSKDKLWEEWKKADKKFR